jgi:GNAT superfamily N-acetyltransferase
MDLAFTVRPASPDDSISIFELVQLLAEYEKAPEMVINTPEKIRKHGFGENPLFLCWIAENEDGCLGMALCYLRYSTWKGPVLYLEDIVVKDEYRRHGVGTALFQCCLDYARQNGFARLSWQVLEWNEPAIKFYKKYGADFDGEWVNCSLDLSNEPMD